MKKKVKFSVITEFETEVTDEFVDTLFQLEDQRARMDATFYLMDEFKTAVAANKACSRVEGYFSKDELGNTIDCK